MAGPVYPDVPVAAGVPAVKRGSDNPGTATETRLDGDSITVAATSRNTWGVFGADNAKVLDPDTIMAFSYDGEYRIADFPIEEGGFESYDKVAMPFDVRVVMSKGGKTEERRAFLSAVDELRSDLKLYYVITPERTYYNVNITRISVDRSREQGAGLVTVEMHLREIRQNVSTTFSKSKDAASANPVNAGSVQPEAPSASVTQAVAAKVSAAAATPLSSASAIQTFFDTAAGRVLSTIPLVANIPAQVLKTQLAGTAVQLALTQKRTGLFADIVVAGTQIAAGVLCRDGVPLLPTPNPLFPGNLALFDTAGGVDPVYSGLGDRFQMVWGH